LRLAEFHLLLSAKLKSSAHGRDEKRASLR
jgi:hypothetical protein